MTDLARQLLAARTGVAVLVVGEASGRLDAALADVGETCCLVGHAVRELARGTDDGRLERLRRTPPVWLVDAAERVAARPDIGWWSAPLPGSVQRASDGGLTGTEHVDRHGRRRSLPEEVLPHLRTFTSDRTPGPVDRWRVREPATLELRGPDDLAALGEHPPADVDAVHLTLRGLLTIDPPPGSWWPWRLGGTWWRDGIVGDELDAHHPEPWPHDHGWVEVGRPVDPRFDEGDEVDGSELTVP